MNLSEIKKTLTQHQIRLTKALGQNFLHDQNQVRRIIAAAELAPQTQVLEIGPGLGPLTEVLLAHDVRLHAVEIDQRLISILNARFENHPCFHLIHADALGYLKHHDQPWSGWTVVSNLPYSVASPILVELCMHAAPPDRIVTTLQLEVARRAVATPRSADYGILTLLLGLKFHPSIAFRIPPTSFFPPPDVESACLVLQKRESALLPPTLNDSFERLVKRAFSQRRKTALKVLRADWPAESLTAAWTTLRFNPAARAEELSLNDYTALTLALSVNS